MADYQTGDLVRCEVVFDLPIVDAVTGEDVERGGVAQLKAAPEQGNPPPPPGEGETRIDLLVACGLIKVLPASKPAAKAKE
jgi:hypothetical protein